MRLFIMMLILSLSACGGSNGSVGLQGPPGPAGAPAPVTTIAAMQVQISALQKQISALTLIGKVNVGASNESINNIRGVAHYAITNGVNFGPCIDMGVLIGFTNGNGEPADALSATGQDFRQCTGYSYATNVADGSIATGERIFWDGPNCTGNLIEWEASGAGFSTAALKNGVVFSSPFDGSILMVRGGQTPQPIFIQSVWVRENPGCQSDTETQLMYKVSPNDFTVSGVPNSIGIFQLGAP